MFDDTVHEVSGTRMLGRRPTSDKEPHRGHPGEQCGPEEVSHRHAYAEVFVVQEGQARFTVGSDTLEVSGGHIVVVPADRPHKVVNSGIGQLRMINIHAAGKIVTEWLEA